MFPRAILLLLTLVVAPPALAGTTITDVTLSHGGVTRYFDYFVPDDLPATPVPLLFLLHGGTQDNDLLPFGANGRFLSLAEEHKFIVVMPNGIDPVTGLSGPSGDFNWNDCRLDAGPAETGADDVGFLAAVLDWAELNLSIDPDRVYSTGSSNGGMMSFRLAFELPDRIAAVATNIANVPLDTDCPAAPASPVSVMMMMGTADPIMPFAGGTITGGRGTVLSAPATRDFWTGFLATPLTPNPVSVPNVNSTDGSTVTFEAFCDGAESSAVVYGVVDGGGHTIPSVASYIGPTLEGFLGKQNRDFEMADGAWSFLRYQHRTGTDAACGNWCIEPGEECDDGNQTDGDGCSATCVAVFPALPILSFGGLAALVLGFFGLGVVALRRSTAG